MAVDERNIQTIVERVLNKLAGDPAVAGALTGGKPAPRASSSGVVLGRRGVFGDVDGAVQAARDAFEQFQRTSLDKRAKAIANIRALIRERAVEFSQKAVAETTFGRVEDKIGKNLLVADRTPGIESLPPYSATGDAGLMLEERAPYGVICAITPVTNATETILCNVIGMIAGGNAVSFNVHPGAKHLSRELVGLINDAIVSAGCPENLVTMIAEPTIQSADKLMRHPMTPLVVVTGGPGVVNAAMKTGKKVIAAGPGNPPAVVDDTVDLSVAAKDIVQGASLDNNIVCIVEKEIIALDAIADELKRQLCTHGAYELKPREIRALEDVVFKDGRANTKCVGQDAAKIMKMIGVTIPADTRIVFGEVPESHLFMQEELLMPVLGFARVRTIDEAIAMAKRVEHGFRHTATMHSNDIRRLHEMARTMDCSIFVKNGPSFAGLGLGGEGYTSFTIASPTGEGLTAPIDFTRCRRCTLKDSFRIA